MREYFLAVDIGASGGRHIVGSVVDGKMVLDEVYRFRNGMDEAEDGTLYWDTDRLYEEIVTGLEKCKELEKVPRSMAIDTWGVDFVLLDAKDQPLGRAVAYRDSRTKGMDAKVYEKVAEEILYNAKPHIGTDKLRDTVKNIREELLALGADVFFDTKLVDIKTVDGTITAAEVEHEGNRRLIDCAEIVLAIGHSARDTFELIHRMGVHTSPKPFSVGARIEHLRENINRSQYGEAHRLLPAAYYKQSVHLKDGRGVYTFCMCPGGLVVAAQSEKDSVVTNGMSEFARDKVNSNAALLVSVNPEDIPGDHALKGMYWQRELERKAFLAGGGDYRAPVTRVGDFLNGGLSERFGEVLPSYRPGTRFARMDEILPRFVTDAMREALPMIDRKLRGFNHPDAVLTAVESRSSSPIRITRNESLQSASLKGLYPCGEGAGYAGGIVSAAVDGIKVAEKIIME